MSRATGLGDGRATMVDVAGAAGVSLKTVSRVINGEPGVRQGTTEKVLRAARSLRYERNDLAASLRHGMRTFSLGLIIEDVTNPFYSEIAQAVEEVARERSSLLITASAREDSVDERQLVTMLLRRRVDALLVVPAGGDHRYLREAIFETPVVFVDRPPAGIQADTVLIDNAAGAERAVNHLLAHGHQRVAFIGMDRSLYTARERLVGYRRALKSAGMKVDNALVSNDNSTSTAATETTSRLLSLPRARRPTAIFTANNRCTVGALQALGTRDRHLALVGFDDLELADLLELTVIRTDPRRIGELAARLAFARIDGDRSKPNRLVLPAQLVPRGSGEIRPRGSGSSRGSSSTR